MKSFAFWFAGYAVLAAVLAGWLVWVRGRMLQDPDNAINKAQWQQYRTDLGTEAAKNAPYRHKVPTSEDPPILVMMRDRFPVMVIGAMVSLAVFYGMAGFLVVGLRRKPPVGAVGASSQPPGVT